MARAQTSPQTSSAAVPSRAEEPRWRRRVVLGALGLSLLGNGVQWAASDSPSVGAWRGTSGRSTYDAAYDRVLAVMPSAQEDRLFPTSFGIAHAMRFGTATGTPLLMVPGWGSGIPMWQDLLPHLRGRRTVWALDAIGDAGRSTQSVPFTRTADEATWIAETIAGLGVPRVHLLGHSFGGRIAAEVALRHPDRVATVSLIEPVLTVSSFHAGIYLWSIPASVPFLPPSWKDAALAKIGGTEEIDRDDPLTALIAAGTEGYAAHRPTPSRLTEEQLDSLPMPVLVALGLRSSLHADPAAAAATARRAMPDATVLTWSDGTHSLPMQHPEEVCSEVLGFADAHEPA